MPLIPDKFSLQINMGTVILSLIMTIGGGMTGKFGYKGADEAVVQVAIMILVVCIPSMQQKHWNITVTASLSR